MEKHIFFLIILILLVFTPKTIDPPKITATSNPNPYCPGTFANIVDTVGITFDPLEPKTNAASVQISSGYIFGEDSLTLSETHTTINFKWIPAEGKLKLYTSTGSDIPYTDFEAAIADVKFSTSSTSPSGTRTFSINLGTGQLSYLPRNKHFYEYVYIPGITWIAAKAAATARTYDGLQGYLATLTDEDEAQLAGKQAPGNGWIGGSDAASEGVWKWVTGPEGLANGGLGKIFWVGVANGSTPNFAYWNANEPNQARDEDYAHITAPGIGIKGSWNDLPNVGGGGPYASQGYIVEYGGMIVGDVDNIQISASTSLAIPKISGTTPATRCGSGSVTLKATASDGTIYWYDIPAGGISLGTGNYYTTLPINTTTTYYVDNGCPNRIAIIAEINTIPDIISTNSGVSRCGSGTVTLQASADIGNVNWYSTATGGPILAIRPSFTTQNLTANSTYYAEADNNGCVSTNRTRIDIKVYSPLIVTDETVVLCKSSAVELDAGFPGMSYSWTTGGETTQKITAYSVGIYTVIVTSPLPENCPSTKTIKVIEPNIPEIDRVDVNETKVVIYLKQEEPYYEFSVDGSNYQSSNVFFNVQSGLQTAYVRDVNLCSKNTQTFIVLIAPKFFTPNGDTYNDTWEVEGLFNYPQAQVSIFDRYGKLISVLNKFQTTWDGMFNNRSLPADDYWYVLKINETTPEKRGHFSLIR